MIEQSCLYLLSKHDCIYWAIMILFIVFILFIDHIHPELIHPDLPYFHQNVGFGFISWYFIILVLTRPKPVVAPVADAPADDADDVEEKV